MSWWSASINNYLPLGIHQLFEEAVHISYIAQSIELADVEVDGEGDLGQIIERRSLLAIDCLVLLGPVVEHPGLSLLGELLEVNQVLGAGPSREVT